MNLKTKEIILCGMFAALIAVGAFIKLDIPLPLYTMHFTLQWFFVLMAGFLLGEKLGSISVLVYILIGLLGVPVFAAGGGLTYIFRPGFGFLLGFIPAAYFIGLLSRKMKCNSAFKMIVPAAVGEIVYYTVGAVYFYMIKNFYVGAPVTWSVVIVDYCLITVLPDFLLCVFAAVFCHKLKPHFVTMIAIQNS
jgi:biotin transport system substrate-specific component